MSPLQHVNTSLRKGKEQVPLSTTELKHSFSPKPSSEVAESLGIDQVYPSSSTSSTVIKPPVGPLQSGQMESLITTDDQPGAAVPSGLGTTRLLASVNGGPINTTEGFIPEADSSTALLAPMSSLSTDSVVVPGALMSREQAILSHAPHAVEPVFQGPFSGSQNVMVMNSTINMINNVKMGQSTGRKQVEREAKYEPNPPKRALSAFMFFSQDWRERIKIEKPDACFGEVGKLLGAKWKELDDEGKKSYIEQAAKDKERYENEKSAYVRIVSLPYEVRLPTTELKHSFAPQPSSEVAESLGIDEAYPSSSTSSTVIKPPKAERKAKYEPDAPKRALSAYMFFSQDWRERIKIENPDACFGEVGKLLAVKWKELGDEGKKSYIEQAAKDKERYENEKSAYTA